jgi:hypothetical protein
MASRKLFINLLSQNSAGAEHILNVGNKLTIILIWKFGTNIVHLFVQNNVHKNKYYESNNNFHST